MRSFWLVLNILIVGNSFSQNWNLIDAEKTFFYKHVDSLYITNTIDVDSTQISGSDTLYFIHTTIKICDTCTVIPPNAVGGVLYHAYWPEIFGLSPLYSNATKEFIFQDGSIKHTAEISDSWLFNSTLGINATVVDKYETTILGQIDSFKVIELSTLDTILISKNHGVIRYPDFENAGKYFLHVGYHEGQNSYGEYLPNMWRIYDFQIGDAFYYSHYYSYISSEPDQCFEGMNSKHTVMTNLTSQTYPSYDFFQTHKFYFGCVNSGVYEEYTGNGSPNYYLDSSRAYFENQFSGITNIWNENDNNLEPFYLFQYNSFLVGSPYYIDTSNCRNFISHRYDNGYIKFIQTMSSSSDSLYFIDASPSYEVKLEFKEGLGRTYLELYSFEELRTDELKAWISDGDTVGNIFQFSALQESTDEIFRIYPNPALDQITIPENLSLFSIYSLSGKLIYIFENPDPVISISELNKGVYLIKAIDKDNNQFQQKLIVE